MDPAIASRRPRRKRAPVDLSAAAGEHSTPMPRVRIGELELFHTTDGAGEPVLLLMGLGGEHRAWDLVRRELARRYRLVLVDNRDAGASDETHRPYGTGDMAADALGVIDHLGIERFHVVGASMGGARARAPQVGRRLPAPGGRLPRARHARAPAPSPHPDPRPGR